jgi:hypothetical protein
MCKIYVENKTYTLKFVCDIYFCRMYRLEEKISRDGNTRNTLTVAAEPEGNKYSQTRNKIFT